MSLFFVFVFGFLFLSFPSVFSASSSAQQIHTPHGRIDGITDSLSHRFLGIPFAQPPINSLRFASPLPLKVNPSAVVNAQKFSAGCIQKCNLPSSLCPLHQSEDCLYLNVFSPLDSSSSSHLPVLVFIPGGNYNQGAAGVPAYDAGEFAHRHHVIVVTINYRLGAFGFFWDHHDIPANLGLLDQQMALRWVNENIHSFGGNPQQITLMGQSAGAMSVLAHMQNADSSTLFQKAITMSIPIGITLRLPSEMSKLNVALSQKLHCGVDDSQCIKSKSADDILAAQLALSNDIKVLNSSHFTQLFQLWEPTIHMESFSIPHMNKDFFESLMSGHIHQVNHIPLLIGTTSEEAVVFVGEIFDSAVPSYIAAAMEIFLFGYENFRTFLSAMYPLQIWESSAHYDAKPQLNALVTDFLFTCETRRVALDYSSVSSSSSSHGNGNSNTYLYIYSHLSSQSKKAWGDHYPFCWNAVCHGSDLPLLFLSDKVSGFPLPPVEREFAVSFGTYFANFAKSGNPNLPEAVPINWPSYDNKRHTMMFQDAHDFKVVTDPSSSHCDKWDSTNYQFDSNLGNFVDALQQIINQVAMELVEAEMKALDWMHYFMVDTTVEMARLVSSVHKGDHA